MDLGPPPRRSTGEPVVAMINVVFLLLCFFMMTATLTTPSPFEVSPPASASADRAAREAARAPLHVGAQGQLAWNGVGGDAALDALARARRAVGPGLPRLEIRADAGLDGARLAALLARLRALGVDEARLALRRAE
ncbi:MAG: biopolymer transporter ExbD [Pseudomonadota bacterium]|nr:biopolymer transporter ExbD [Pseudomonadota bacterium]